MKVFNPTGWTRNLMVDSKQFKISPFNFMEFSDDYGQILVTSEVNRDLGIVPLEYDDGARAKYRNFEVFKRAQAISGLKTLLSHYYRVRSHEISAYDAMVKQNSHPDTKQAERITANVNRFDEEIALVEQWLSIWEKYTPSDYVESETYVEEETEKPVLEFDPAQIASNPRQPFGPLPVGLEPHTESKPRAGRKQKNESFANQNPSA